MSARGDADWAKLEQLAKERGFNFTQLSKAIGRSSSFLSGCKKRNDIHAVDIYAIIKTLEEIEPISEEEQRAIISPNYKDPTPQTSENAIPNYSECVDYMPELLSVLKDIRYYTRETFFEVENNIKPSINDIGQLIQNIAEELCK